MILFWVLTLQVKKGRFTFMEKPVLALSGLVERIIIWPYHTIVSLGKGYIFLVGTHQENLRMSAEMERLLLENAVMNELLIENGRFREILDFKQLHPLSGVVAQVIARDSSPASSTITINKGADHGVRKDMAVIISTGVVGRIQMSLAGTAKVLLLNDPGSAVAVRVMRNREEGLLEGKLVNCALKYVSFYADIQEGDLLITSGLDGIYPKGHPVATVVKVRKHEASAFQSVVALPAVRFSRLEEVLVLTQ
jgi:rod shape-determining protein MreC